MESLDMTDREFRESERFYDAVICGRRADELSGVTGEEAEWEEEREPEENDAE